MKGFPQALGFAPPEMLAIMDIPAITTNPSRGKPITTNKEITYPNG